MTHLKKHFSSEKDLRIFIKHYLKSNLKGVRDLVKAEIIVKNLKPPLVCLKLPFYSEGNLIRCNEVDFLIKKLEESGIRAEVYYADDWNEFGY
jgi:hypothetical protein